MKIKHSVIAVMFVMMTSGICHAQHKASPTYRDWSEDARTITEGTSDKYRQAENIYRWICANISFDTSNTVFTADECWEKKTGGSQGFCEVYQRLAEAVGLETYIISGKIKNLHNEISQEDHLWLMVKIKDGWILTDPTWGAGSVSDGVFTKSDGDMSWFHVDPYIMIMSHFPTSKGDQLISPSIDYETFAKLPYIDPAVARLGMNGRQTLNAAIEGKLDQPFTYGTVTEDMLIREIPMNGTVRQGDICRFISGNSLKYNYEIRIDDEPIPAICWNVNASTRTAEFIISGEKKMVIYVLDRNAPEGEVAAAFEYKIIEGDKNALEAIAAYDPYLTDEIRSADNANIPFMRQLGIDGHKVLSDLRAHEAYALPVMYKNLEKIEIIDVPFHSPLKVGETYTFEFRSNTADTFVIINEDIFIKNWDKSAKKQGIYKKTVTIEKPGFIGIGINVGGKEYKLLLEYEVIY